MKNLSFPKKDEVTKYKRLVGQELRRAKADYPELLAKIQVRVFDLEQYNLQQIREDLDSVTEVIRNWKQGIAEKPVAGHYDRLAKVHDNLLTLQQELKNKLSKTEQQKVKEQKATKVFGGPSRER